MRDKVFYILLVFVLSGCEWFQKKEIGEPIARVNETFLYKEDLEGLIPENLSKEDSLLRVNNYIRRWATEQVFMSQAKINLPKQQQEEFEDLVQAYRKELFIEAYKDIVINQQIDTAVNPLDIEKYYQSNRANFKLNQKLVKLRYLYVDQDFPDLKELKERLDRFDTDDKQYLENQTLSYKAAALNDSVWVTARSIYEEIKPLKDTVNELLLKKGKFLQLNDSTNVYLVKVKDVLLRNEEAPLEYVKPTIKQILLNRRKLELSKKLEKEITEDALKHERFEIYN
ncbi:peptidyl-prolyl cis-trans isomerase [Haloflavibacter putidus]|uniref:Peptidyl-prolyl cis-trans isomerase n=1 Tax=Haloflavibacter putidus TaxID=2576776 RepID=A0A507ZMX2_9FLAO|nr:peptidyl-prolyl cis-trans isomerase [Haloflavibacter putidus]TQD38629.1 peptidyl-prolyl cis-trans isomerase [Haloflavibacter putidus]